MTARFVDTSILLYSISTDPGETAKVERARRILEARDLRLSVQVLQGFYVQATRASRPDALSHHQAAGLVQSFLRFRPATTTKELMPAALDTRDRFQIS